MRTTIYKNIYVSLLFIIFQLLSVTTIAQKEVAFTIDDIQMDHFFLPPGYSTTLCDTINKANIPVTILISEGRLFKGYSIKRFKNIEKWIANPLITVGSHTYSHLHYSDTTLDFYKDDIEKGLSISVPLAQKYNKSLQYFRFPFNDLGKDSIQHTFIKRFLEKKNITITPFSIESEDYAYAYLYEYYIWKKDSAKALQTAQRYINQTLALFDFFESAGNHFYGRQVKQIYLCHDNLLNQHYLGTLIRLLKTKGYNFIALDNAMEDPIYGQPDTYYKKWGLSWIYRLNFSRIKTIPKKEPDDSIDKEYEQLLQKMNTEK